MTVLPSAKMSVTSRPGGAGDVAGGQHVAVLADDDAAALGLADANADGCRHYLGQHRPHLFLDRPQVIQVLRGRFLQRRGQGILGRLVSREKPGEGGKKRKKAKGRRARGQRQGAMVRSTPMMNGESGKRGKNR